MYDHATGMSGIPASNHVRKHKTRRGKHLRTMVVSLVILCSVIAIAISSFQFICARGSGSMLLVMFLFRSILLSCTVSLFLHGNIKVILNEFCNSSAYIMFDFLKMTIQLKHLFTLLLWVVYIAFHE